MKDSFGKPFFQNENDLSVFKNIFHFENDNIISVSTLAPKKHIQNDAPQHKHLKPHAAMERFTRTAMKTSETVLHTKISETIPTTKTSGSIRPNEKIRTTRRIENIRNQAPQRKHLNSGVVPKTFKTICRNEYIQN